MLVILLSVIRQQRRRHMICCALSLGEEMYLDVNLGTSEARNLKLVTTLQIVNSEV